MLRIALIGTMALPPPIFIIPLYVLLSDANLTNNLVVLGLVYAAWNASFGLYLIHAYLQRGLPTEVLEAARVDGASVWQTFRRIVIPLLPAGHRDPGRADVCLVLERPADGAGHYPEFQ